MGVRELVIISIESGTRMCANRIMKDKLGVPGKYGDKSRRE